MVGVVVSVTLGKHSQPPARMAEGVEHATARNIQKPEPPIQGCPLYITGQSHQLRSVTSQYSLATPLTQQSLGGA